MCKSARLTIFLTAEFRGKRAKLSKLGKKTAQKMGATDQPRYNDFRIIRDRVITVAVYREKMPRPLAAMFFDKSRRLEQSW